MPGIVRALLFLLCLPLCGCAHVPPGFYGVWTLPFPPPADTPAPAGFTVTPAQAFQIARESRRLSRKHLWHLYADVNHYYVHDTFPGIGAHKAYKQSLHIDGRTGAVVKKWKPPHESSERASAGERRTAPDGGAGGARGDVRFRNRGPE